jgi:predicted PurR-regulated permease PerM
MEYLDKNVFNKTTTITTTTFTSTINHIDEYNDTFNSIDEGSSEVTQSDTTTLTPEIRSNSNHSLDYTSEYLFETTNEINISYLNKSIIQNIDDSINHNKTDKFFEQHEREVNVVSTNDWIIFGSVFFVLFLLLFLVYYVIKRYKSGRKRRGKHEFIRFDIIRQIFD